MVAKDDGLKKLPVIQHGWDGRGIYDDGETGIDRTALVTRSIDRLAAVGPWPQRQLAAEPEFPEPNGAARNAGDALSSPMRIDYPVSSSR